MTLGLDSQTLTADAPGRVRPVRAAFIGGGFMASVHSRAARAARAELIGGVSSSPESSRRAAAEYGLDRSYDSLEELLADPEVDVVHVCTPNALHFAQAHAVIAAGKHVICEKPLGITAAEALSLTEAAAAAGVVAAVPFVYRFHPMVREARARVASGEVGRLLSIHGSYLQDWLVSSTDDDWRVDPEHGGRSRAFADIGSHLVDLVEFVTGDRVSRVSATKRTFFAERARNKAISTEDAIAITVETAAGALGTLLVSQAAPGRKNRLELEIAGENQSLMFNQERPEELWIGRQDGNSVLLRDPATLSPDAARLCTVPAGHAQGYQDAFNAFIADAYRAIAGQVPEGLPVFADGLRAAQLTEAVFESAESGSWVSTAETLIEEKR